MKNHKFLEHTADILIEASGNDYAEALEEAAKALMETVADIEKIEKQNVIIKIIEKAPNIEELIVFSLSSILSEAEINEIFFYDCKVERLEKIGDVWVVEMILKGSNDLKKAKTIVKAVTFCQINVEKDEKMVKINVVFDI